MLRLYTKNDCIYCDVMKEKLAEWGVKYSTINVSINDIGLKYLKDSGYRTVPQLMYEDYSLNDDIDTREFTFEQFCDNLINAVRKHVPAKIAEEIVNTHVPKPV